MGNKFPGSRRTCASDVRDFFLRRQRADDDDDVITPRSTSAKKINSSCPDLVPPASRHQNFSSKEDAGEEKDGLRPIRLKIYRSYGDIADPKTGASYSEVPSLEIRVYRRSSTEGLVAPGARVPCVVGRAVSLPRGMERSLIGGTAASDTSSTGTEYRSTSRQCGSSRRGSSRCSMTSVGCRGKYRWWMV